MTAKTSANFRFFHGGHFAGLILNSLVYNLSSGKKIANDHEEAVFPFRNFSLSRPCCYLMSVECVRYSRIFLVALGVLPAMT